MFSALLPNPDIVCGVLRGWFAHRRIRLTAIACLSRSPPAVALPVRPHVNIAPAALAALHGATAHVAAGIDVDCQTTICQPFAPLIQNVGVAAVELPGFAINDHFHLNAARYDNGVAVDLDIL